MENEEVKTNEERVFLNIVVPKSLSDEVRLAAAKKGLTKTAYVTQCIRQYLKRDDFEQDVLKKLDDIVTSQKQILEKNILDQMKYLTDKVGSK